MGRKSQIGNCGWDNSHIVHACTCMARAMYILSTPFFWDLVFKFLLFFIHIIYITSFFLSNMGKLKL